MRPLVVNTMQYEVEGCCDYVTVNGVQYRNSPPNGVKMAKGAALEWYSDASDQLAGWKVCAHAQDTMTTTKPTDEGRYMIPTLSARRL